MKKYFILAAAAIAALSACTKEIIDTPEEITDPEEIVASEDTAAPVFTATIDPTTKTTLANGTKVNWENTDEVSVSGIVYSVAPGSDETKATLTKKTSSDGTPSSPFKAYYPASIYSAGTATLPASYTYAEGKFNMPMYAENTETTLAFKNICAVLAITVPSTQMSSVTSITVSSDKQMNGAFTATAEGVLTFADKTLEAADKKVTLTFSTAKAIASSETFYIAVPANTYGYLQIDVTDGTTTKYMRTKTGSSISVDRNTIYPLTFANNYDPNLLTGVFSVSATKKVKFTKGNLWWDGSAYQFEANQTAYPEAWNTSHVGHFFWSSYADYTITDDDAKPGKPYEFKPYFKAYGSKSKSASDEFWCSKDHPLEVAGTQGLYVLSSDEWKYLLNAYPVLSSGARTQTNRFAKARVNGKAGLLIFPDGYNGTTTLTGITGMCTINEDWDDAYPGESESIPTDTWSAMEAAGVVFLPAAGYRIAETIKGSGYCQYWSSTPVSNDVGKAYGLYGTNYGAFTCPGNTDRSNGSSIRLVKTVE